VLLVNLKISRVQLLARKRQTIIAMLGVTFGIAMFILMISFMKGVNQFLHEVMLSSTPDIHIYNDFKADQSSSITARFYQQDSHKLVIVHHLRPKQINLGLKNAPGIIADLKKDPNITIISPLVSAPLFFDYGSVQVGASVDGVNILEENRLFHLKDKMKSGQLENLLNTQNGIILGDMLASKLNVVPGDLVTLNAPSGTQGRFRVIGTFKFGIGAIDAAKCYVNLSSLQQLLSKNRDYITDIRIKLADNSQAKVLAPILERKYGYKSDDWETTNASMIASDTIRDVLTFVVSFTLLMVAGFGIYNIMNMVITNKMKDIAILKAQGFSGKDIVQIFLSQSLTIGVFGTTAGLILGYLLSYLVSRVPFPGGDIFSLKYFPVLFEPKYYFFGALFGMLTTLLAGVTPAIKASKIDPVAILRGNQ